MSDTVVVTVPEEVLRLTLNAMVNLVVTKGKQQSKDYHKLMVSLYEITTWCRKQGHQVPRVDIERALDILTTPDNYARYYTSEYEGKRYRYYGLTKKFWAIVEPQHAEQLTGVTA